MTRQEQLIINDYCEREIPIVESELANIVSVKRLRTCNAYVYETDGYYILRSYSTFVAFIRKDDCECFDILRKVYGFTSTSSQHIAKFKHDYHAVSTQTLMEV